MKSKVDDLLDDIEEALSAQKALENELEHHLGVIEQADKDILTSKKAVALVQAVATETQKLFEVRFSNLVSTALSVVFGDAAYTFKASFIEKRGRMECTFTLERDGESVLPEDTVGGGVMDVLSFALRIAFWSLKKTEPVFILDEPFKFLSPSHHQKASFLLETLSKRLRIQFIVVSHQEGMVKHADAVWEVVDGKTRRIAL